MLGVCCNLQMLLQFISFQHLILKMQMVILYVAKLRKKLIIIM